MDFDDTIFNTQAFINDLAQVFISADFSERDFDHAYKKTKEEVGFFSIDAIVDSFAKLKEFDITETQKALCKVLDDTSKYIFEDFYYLAPLINPQKIALLSLGDGVAQKTKIENSGITPYVKEVMITSTDKKAVFEKEIIPRNKDKKIFFLDDKARHIEEVKVSFPQVVAIKVERPEGRHTVSKSALADYTINNLYEMPEIIKEESAQKSPIALTPF